MIGIRKLAIGAACLLTVSSSLLTVAAPAAHAAGYTVNATPSTNLVNNEIVTVTATGFPANDPNIVIAECGAAVSTEGLSDCVTANLVRTSSNASGQVAAPLQICVPVGPGECIPVDCGQPGSCWPQWWANITVLDSTEPTSIQGSVQVTSGN